MIRSNRKRSVIWRFFKTLGSFTAKCKVCDQDLSYASTSHNLRNHLTRRHQIDAEEVDPNEIEEFINEKRLNLPTEVKKERKSKHSWIWQIFKKKSAVVATCTLCGDDLKYFSSISNLINHVRRQHSLAYEELKRPVKAQDGDLTYILEADEESNSSLQQQDVYFEEEDGQISCTVCKKNISDEGEDPRGHLEEHHPGLLARILKNEDQSEDANTQEQEEEKDIFTEVVYLDAPESKPHKRLKYIEKSPSSAKKPRLSSYDHDFGRKVTKIEEKVESPSELDSFLSYIKVLLKKLPNEVCSRVQLDIINVIMTAQFQVSSLPSNLPSNSASTSSDVIANAAANASIVLDTSNCT